MGSQRAHIVLPDDLVQEIDRVVGPRGRSSFLVETARAELRRRRLLTLLRGHQPIWQANDHPELISGAAAWVREVRKQGDARVPIPKRSARKPAAKPAK
jgi:hypothetical protein